MSKTTNDVARGRKRNTNPSNGSGNLPDASLTSDNGQVHARSTSGITNGTTNATPGTREVAAAVAHTAIPAWLNIGFMLALIFGGCCANVFTLESIVTDMPHAGALITFTQFAVTSLLTLPNVFSFAAGPGALFLKTRGIPITQWIIFTAFFTTVNLMNNSAFLFKISVPLHIIIRSAGPVTSMIIGYLYNSKRYTRVQVFAVSLLSLGVVTAALADARAKGKSIDVKLSSDPEASSVLMMLGFAVLGLAMILGAFQGVYADRLFQKYGREHWREGLFYSHALSLFTLIPTYSKFVPQINTLRSSPSILASLPSLTPNPSAQHFSTGSKSTFGSLYEPFVVSLVNNPFLLSILSHVPLKLVYLLLNALTQFLCIRGVYLLSAKSSSLTVTVVLNIRKLVSLILSVYLFGNHLSQGVLVGAGIVFLAGGIYAWEGARLRARQFAKKEKSG